MEITKSLAKVRKAKGYSQTKVAAFLQTTQQQYSKYEKGIQEIPVRHIIKLCDFYKITANKLLGIETFMSEKESNNKFLKLYEETHDMINWARYQEHINYEAENILINNLNEIKEQIENE